LAFQLAKNKNLVQQNEIALLSEKNNLLKAKQELAETKLANQHLFLALLSFIIVILTLFGLRLCRDHKRVKELAEYDQLTGIFNRGHFTQVALRALKYCQSAEQDLSIIVFDLDHFKKVNDSFGHLCGDWALKEVSKACQAIGRQNDIFARLGGEEFCIMLPSCNIKMAALRAEACRAAIEAIITETSGYEFTITASFGVTDVCLSDFNLDKLLADADAAAYQSKHAGRNQVTVHQVNDVKKEPLLNSTFVTTKQAT
jgi:diguanylate cyclase (GGDEF)-like protein